MSSPYSFYGTPQPSRDILSAVLSADSQKVKEFLKKLPPTATIGWLWEPYATLWSEKQFACLTLVMNDSRFRFDARFVASCCYFTPPSLRKLVIRHPKAKRWVMRPEQFEQDYISECLNGPVQYNEGLRHRMYYARNDLYSANKLYMKTQRKRIAFFLYPFLVTWARCFVEDYYAPGGKAFLKAKGRFEAALLC